jgi:allantoate deiminase
MLADQAREVIRRCRVLATRSEEPGGTTRTFLSQPMHQVHADLRGWMEALDMAVRVDAAGNLRGFYPGTAPAARRILIGSHLDTVPNAGAFDGILGVVMGVALVARLAGRRLPFGIEVIGFSDEEGVRFGAPFIGSRALAGTLDEDLLERRDAAGRTVRDAIRDFGLDPAAIAEAGAAPDAIAFLEFHIEQGPVLESLELPLAVVNTIVGQHRLEVVFTGAANHAGTTPMAARRDAVACAAEWILTVEAEARKTPWLVATVGRIEAMPGAANVVAGRCVATLDLRHPADDVRRAALETLTSAAASIAATRAIGITTAVLLDQPSVPMDPTLVGALERASARSGAPVHRMPSGAGHDAMIVAGRMPAAMLFLRSPGGISHHPDESVLEQDVALALATGLEFLDEMAHGGGA